MARPTKEGLDYFPYDVDLDQDDKLGMIIGEFQEKGEKLYTKLLCWIYKHEGYFTKWDEEVQLRFLRRYGYCGFSMGFIKEVVPRCIKWGLFDKTVFDAFQILTSQRIQKTWLEASRKRSSRIVIKNIWLLPIIGGIKAEEIEFPAEETHQKEIKGKEIKLKPNGVAPAKPPPTKKIDKNESKAPPEPHWDQLVKVWFDFNKEKFKIVPSFKGRDPSFFKIIVGQLKKRAESKSLEWNADIAADRMRKFLNYAYADPWLKDHFLLENLNKQFDLIIKPKKRPTGTLASASKTLPKMQRDINDLYAGFLDGEIKIGTYSAEHFDYLADSGEKFNHEDESNAVNSARQYMAQQEINQTQQNLDALKRVFGIQIIFERHKKQGHETVFRVE